MSFTQKEILNQLLSWQNKKEEEVHELNRLTNRFAENERTKKAKDIVFSERFEGLRNQFSQFFSAEPHEEPL